MVVHLRAVGLRLLPFVVENELFRALEDLTGEPEAQREVGRVVDDQLAVRHPPRLDGDKTPVLKSGCGSTLVVTEEDPHLGEPEELREKVLELLEEVDLPAVREHDFDCW